MASARFKWETRGKALNENMVIGSQYRFTILTDCLIRMEYDARGLFEDRASQSFFYRDFDKSEYKVTKQDGMLSIETEQLLLCYQDEAAFTKETLSIRMKHVPGAVWHYGESVDQLKGTVPTLDWINGCIPLQDGVCSRNGYAIVDDSDSLLLTEEGWFDLRAEGTQDLYFFGYGHKYLRCIQDFYRITGAPPLLPDYALGNWWSRYYNYTQQEYCDLMERFEKEELPFSVAVVDMGWHLPGWTGYTWNEEFFPDYKGFLKFLKEHNLKTSLNLHPAEGVKSHEAMYEEMAIACGIDPKTEKQVKLDCLNPEFMEKYFDILHHPYEDAGVDFWWMDWQQGTNYWWIHDDEHAENPLEKMNPLWLLNHLHILDISRNGKRPMFFSRYSGLGSHRYPVGFSGDTVVTWESLDFQPYFTANASNVGYSWWSHDIGGHMFGYRDDEMVVRWMQLGVFSPINRLHSAINPFSGKEPWNLHPYMEQIAGKWLRLRHQLFPYIYTMNYRNHKDLIPMILPMYYSHPEKDAAYNCPNQYWFGSELIVSPITEKADPNTFLSKAKVWLPEGQWIDVFNGFVYQGNMEVEVYRSLEQFPIFAKTGAIVPMQVHTGDNRMGRQENMELYVFAGADNRFTLYEDEGDYNRYQEGEFVQTTFDFTWKSNKAILNIHAADGEISLLPESRNWTIHLGGVKNPEEVKVLVDGVLQQIEYMYDEKNASVILLLGNLSIGSEVEITYLSEAGLLFDNSTARGRMFDIILHAQIGYSTKARIWDYLPKKTDEALFMHAVEREHQVLYRALTEMLMLERNDEGILKYY